MTRHEYRLLDVFADAKFGGNQLAVFGNGASIRDLDMQSIARELQLSETTFILPATTAAADRRVRIFTPDRELPFAGHPTLGTAFVVADGKDTTVRLEEGVGIIPVTFRGAFGQMTQVTPVFEPARVDRATLAATLKLESPDLLGDAPLEIGSAGLPFLFAPVRDLDAVRRAVPPGPGHDAVRGPALGVYVFALGGERGGTHVHGRMFGFTLGITEDAASGSAQGPLGAYLVRHGLVPTSPTTRIRSEQGFEMGRPAIIDIEIDAIGGVVTAARVGGHVVPIGGGWIDL